MKRSVVVCSLFLVAALAAPRPPALAQAPCQWIDEWSIVCRFELEVPRYIPDDVMCTAEPVGFICGPGQRWDKYRCRCMPDGTAIRRLGLVYPKFSGSADRPAPRAPERAAGHLFVALDERTFAVVPPAEVERYRQLAAEGVPTAELREHFETTEMDPPAYLAETSENEPRE